MKIAIIFHRFGPYHIARLNETAGKTETIGIELSGVTDEYNWEKITDGHSFRRITLFPQENTYYLNPRVIKKKLYPVLNEIKPDVIAINGYSDKGGLLALEWCLKNNTKSILMSDSTFYDNKRVFFKEYIKRRLIELYNSALVGGFRQKDYLVFLRYNPSKIFYGYSVVDNDYFENETNRLKPYTEEIKKKYKIKNDFFLASFRFLPRKNIYNLIYAYKAYLEKYNYNGYDLVILGDGGEFDEVKKTINKLKLSEHVYLPGFLQYNQIVEFYASAKVFVHPSIREQWGLVVNEAMASGLPIIISDRCGCVANLVVDGINGYYFNPKSSKELSELMNNFHYNEKLIKEMGKQSKIFIKYWSPALFASNIVKAAEEALNSTNVKSLYSKLILKAIIYSKL